MVKSDYGGFNIGDTIEVFHLNESAYSVIAICIAQKYSGRYEFHWVSKSYNLILLNRRMVLTEKFIKFKKWQ